MATRYPDAWMDELRSRSDIVQIVSNYVTLKKKGRKYWGLCPFHGEKTASFSVDEEQQLFYCFGCKAGGNVIGFIMEIDRCSFQEAVEQLAERAHLIVPEMEEDPDYERRRSQRERLLEANREAARFYHEMLFSPEGSAVLAYLRGRGLSDAVIRKFGLGAAPDQWSALTDSLLSRGFTAEELALAGLSIRKPNSKPFDMFRNRAIFPIIDMHRNVLAFGGRCLGKQLPKYMNTADTLVFNKRKGVYAANLLAQQRHLEHVILVEGYMDVVSLAQFGIEGVCATLGTALTNEQARLLRRFAPRVYLAYDGDSAGQHAILRGLDILEEENIPALVLDFPDGLDPDEFIRRDGADAFRALPVLSAPAYRLRRLKDQYDLSSRDGRIGYARAAGVILRPLDPVEKESFLKDLSIETGFSREILLEQINQSPSPEKHADAAEKPVPLKKILKDAGAPVSGEISAQETLLGLLATGQLPKDMVEEKDFEDPELKSLYRRLISGEVPAMLVDAAVDEETRSRYTRILLSPAADDTDQMIAMAGQCLVRIRKAAFQRQYNDLMQKIQSLSPEDPGITGFLLEAQRVQMQLDKM